MGSISIRRSIQWIPDEPCASEPTSTVVLTSPGKRFVDIRILLDSKAEHGGNDTAYKHFGTVTSKQVDWAFSGLSSSQPLPGGSEGSTHSQWCHLVSNRARDVTNVTDEGDMFPQADGSVLEKGRMVNPATGRETDYEEVWVDGDPQLIPGWNDEEGGGERRCIVLELEDEGRIAGSVVCLGRFCQGVLRKGDEFSFERWACREGGKGWEQTVKSESSLWIPAKRAIEEVMTLTVGDVVSGIDGSMWSVLEAC